MKFPRVFKVGNLVDPVLKRVKLTRNYGLRQGVFGSHF